MTGRLIKKSSATGVFESKFKFPSSTVWYGIYLRVGFIMLKEFAICVRVRNDRSIDQGTGTLLDGMTRGPSHQYHDWSQVEGQVFVQACLDETGAEVVDNDFGWCQGCQASDVGIHRKLAVCVAVEFVKYLHIIKMFKDRAPLLNGLFGQCVSSDV